MKDLNKLQQKTVNNIILQLQNEAYKIKQDTQINIQQKCEQLDIILDTTKFLSNYKENVAILNEHLVKNRFNTYKQQKDIQDIEK